MLDDSISISTINNPFMPVVKSHVWEDTDKWFYALILINRARPTILTGQILFM